jgi:hypothetical protein
MLGTITTTSGRKELNQDLRGEVALQLCPAALLKKRTIARATGHSLLLVSVVARSSVTQKPCVLLFRDRHATYDNFFFRESAS